MAYLRIIFAPLSARKAILSLLTSNEIYINCYDNKNNDYNGACIYDILNIKEKKYCPANTSRDISIPHCPCKHIDRKLDKSIMINI